MRNKNRGEILFLAVPETLRGRVFDVAGGSDSPYSSAPLGAEGFFIDPDIPLPMQVPDEGADAARAALEDLSWEAIVSGMLRVVVGGEAREDWIDYYRRFVLAVRPAIMGEFTEAAVLKARNGDFDLALEILDSLRGLFPASPSVRLNRALVMEQRARFAEKQGGPRAGTQAEEAFAEAENAYAEAMSLQPPFPEVWFNAGFFFLDRKDFARARECFSLYADRAEDESGDGFEERPDAVEKKRRALAVIREIDASGLEDESFREAYALVREGEEEAGMRRIRDFIERRPEVWNGWFVLGWALRRLGRWGDAAAAFERALELGGGNGDTLNELAICLTETGDFRGARRRLEAALREDCENVKIISNLGVLALKTGNEKEAAAFFRTVLEIDPGDPVAGEYLENAKPE